MLNFRRSLVSAAPYSFIDSIFFCSFMIYSTINIKLVKSYVNIVKIANFTIIFLYFLHIFHNIQE
jgi:hypothetical protein